jgi:hypothetical protein
MTFGADYVAVPSDKTAGIATKQQLVLICRCILSTGQVVEKFWRLRI